jgi:hypothetical protein
MKEEPARYHDAARDFVAISRIATASNVLVVNAALPASSVAELIALAKAKPGVYNYASAGIGSPAHLGGRDAEHCSPAIKITHVPYKGAAPGLLDVIAGNPQLIITSPISAAGHMNAGRVRALATTGAQRNPACPSCRPSPTPFPATRSRRPGASRADGYTVRRHCATQRRDRQGDAPRRREGARIERGRDTGGGHAGGVPGLHQRASDGVSGDVIARTGIVLTGLGPGELRLVVDPVVLPPSRRRPVCSTRWQGTAKANQLREHDCATARIAFGAPIAAAILE